MSDELCECCQHKQETEKKCVGCGRAIGTTLANLLKPGDFYRKEKGHHLYVLMSIDYHQQCEFTPRRGVLDGVSLYHGAIATVEKNAIVVKVDADEMLRWRKRMVETNGQAFTNKTKCKCCRP